MSSKVKVNPEVVDERNKYKKIKKRLVLLQDENRRLYERLNKYEKRKLNRFINELYGYLESYLFLKVLASFVYMILRIPYRFFKFILKYQESNQAFVNRKSFKQIQKIIQESSASKIVFFISPIEWDMILKQRPQHIAKYMAEEGILIFYIQKKNTDKTIIKISSNLYSVFAKEYNFIGDIAEKNSEKEIFCQFYSAEWTDINKELKSFRERGVKILFEYVDELSPDISGTEIPSHIIERFEEALNDEDSTYIVATASKLHEDVALYRGKKMALIPNGVEVEHFSKKYSVKDLPFRMMQVYKEGKPIIGYYGAIASWMDFELLCKIAELRPNYNIVLIGLDYDGSLHESDLDLYENIFVLPPVKYDDLPRYASFFDVCMIPFKVNDVTKSTSPIKLFEYMALQKPIVTTNLPECKKYKSVLIGNSYQSFVAMLDQAIENKKDKRVLDELQNEALKNTWEKRAKDTVKLISS